MPCCCKETPASCGGLPSISAPHRTPSKTPPAPRREQVSISRGMAGSPPGFPKGERSLGDTTTATRSSFVASAGAEGDEDEDGCHEWDRVGALHRAEPRERDWGQLIHMQGRLRQLKRILRLFGARAVFAPESQPLSCFFPAHVLQILRSEGNVLLLQTRRGEQLRLRSGFGAEMFRRGEFGTGSALAPTLRVPATCSILLSRHQQASLPSQSRAGRSQSL